MAVQAAGPACTMPQTDDKAAPRQVTHSSTNFMPVRVSVAHESGRQSHAKSTPLLCFQNYKSIVFRTLFCNIKIILKSSGAKTMATKIKTCTRSKLGEIWNTKTK